MQEHVLTGHIARLFTSSLPEFGLRASFTIEATELGRVICAVEGSIAQEFIARHCEGDVVTVSGFHEPRPSTAAANTPWNGRFRVRGLCSAEEVRLAA